MPDCDRPHHARSWCDTHYRRWLSHGDPSIVAVKPYKRATQVYNTERYAALREDVTDLLAAGESPERIIRRLGTTAGALSRRLHRHGDHELARVFGRVERAERAA